MTPQRADKLSSRYFAAVMACLVMSVALAAVGLYSLSVPILIAALFLATRMTHWSGWERGYKAAGSTPEVACQRCEAEKTMPEALTHKHHCACCGRAPILTATFRDVA